MIIAIDVHYRDNYAKAVSIEFDQWDAEAPDRIHEVLVEELHEYIPGSFYLRELPCIMEVLKKSPLEETDLILIDGYVILNDEGKKGLGGHLYDALEGSIPVVGVAKNPFKNNAKYVREVYRGKSKKPLFITALGMDLEEAAEQVKNMKGPNRIPDLLRILDQQTKA